MCGLICSCKYMNAANIIICNLFINLTRKNMPKKKNIKTGGENDVEDNKITASLSYIFILCLVPLLLKRNSEFCQFHAKQGLTITVAWFAFWIIGIIPVLGWLVAFVGTITLLIVSILGIIKTLNGEKWKIPYIYEWSKQWNL